VDQPELIVRVVGQSTSLDPNPRYTRRVVLPGLPPALRERVDAALSDLLPTEDAIPIELHKAMRYACLSPGKRLRPALFLATVRAVGGEPESALPAACALEMVHVFSLIHDDLPALDNDDLRRGRPTCHRVFGEAIAILAGDALFSLAFRVLGEMPLDAEQRVASLLELARQTGSEGVVGGEVLDLLAEGSPPDLALLRTIHRRKTGSLIAASCAIGAMVGGGSEAEVSVLREFGFQLGLAFQIKDDILDETATEKDLGKPIGGDRTSGKMTYPAVMGVAAAQAEADELVHSALAKLDVLSGEVDWLRDLANFTALRSN